MKQSIVLCVVLLFVSSCSNRIYNIVSCEPSLPIKEHQFWSNINIKIHDVRCDYPISSIKDYCVLDSFCYVLLSDNRIVLVDLSDDKILFTFAKTGHAKNELIMASCITCDNNNVYVYDDGKSQIMKFSLDLKFEKSIFVDCYLDKFIKCKDGFLCYTLGEGAYLTSLDNKGKKKRQIKLSNISYDCRICEQSFAVDLSGNVYVKPELSDSIFVWNEGTLELSSLISFVGKEKIKDDGISSCEMISQGKEYSLNYMIFGDYILLSSMKDKKVRFYLYDLITQTCSYGVPPKQMGKYPFIPESQYGNRMFRILPKNECKAFVNIGNNNNMDNDIIILEYIY